MTDLIILAARDLYLVSIILFIVGGYIARDKKQFLLYSVLVGVLVLLLSIIASALYYNPRPFMVSDVVPLIPHVASNGFPSDHTLLTGTLAAIVTVFNPYLGAVMWLLAVVVGVARVLAHVHHSIDIVGSLGIAAASVIAVRYALKRFSTYFPRP